MIAEAKITTSAGETIVIDTVDLAKVQPFTWFRKARNRGACAIVDGEMVDMHRFILDLDRGKATSAVVKHINGNKLDNRRKNLLVTTIGVTIATSGGKHRFVRNASGFKGVSRFVKNGRWRARANVDGKEICLGYYDSPEDAANAYDEAMIKLYGGLAVTNKTLGLLDINGDRAVRSSRRFVK